MSEGSVSILAFLRNGLYGIAYALVPLDLEQATHLLSHKPVWLLPAAVIAIALCAYAVIRMPQESRMAYVRPTIFLFIAGIVAMQSFERWRFYMPSIGLLALCALFVKDVWRQFPKMIVRAAICLVLLLFIGWHLTRAVGAQKNWRLAAVELSRIKESYKQVLAAHPERPIRIDLVTVPAKLGSASVMQVALQEFTREAEAERRQLPGLRYGDARGADLPVSRAIDLYALDLDRGFGNVIIDAVARNTWKVSVPEGSPTRLEPALFKIAGASRRDWKLHNGDTLTAGVNRLTILEADGSMATSILVELQDSSFTPVFFDGMIFR
jgi:hypothetical protein